MSENALLKRYKRSKIYGENSSYDTESCTYYKFSMRLLQNNLHDMLHDVSLETRCQMWFQSDGAPCHILNGMYVNFLIEKFPQR